MSEENIRSCVLCLGGLDPSGGAGIQADIEAVAATGAHALTVATCLTVQNSQQALSMHAVDAHLIAQQLDCLLSDMPIHACKIGVIPNPEVATIIAAFLSRIEGIPVVFDPVMSASVGIHFAEQSNWQVIQQLLLPKVTICTPNQTELALLSGLEAMPSRQAEALFERGLNALLLTTADADTVAVKNTLYRPDSDQIEYVWRRLNAHYHGSGCTLSSALASRLAQGEKLVNAVEQAQTYVHHSLRQGQALGQGQHIPHRVQANKDTFL
ncbi:MAG: hydroxymethylpyrimidine/phosphomethylpyrimidine kinase [Gammaproteobacteria bacterium]|nr:hydroxymethylpyrimidine/phosphomethylpyrimidine kinase [Gammaproteobacteria bacterium]